MEQQNDLGSFDQTTQVLLGCSGRTTQLPVYLKSLDEIGQQVIREMEKANRHCMQAPANEADVIIRPFICEPLCYYLHEGNYAIAHVYGVRIYQKDKDSGQFYHFDGEKRHLWSHAPHEVYIDLPNGEKGRACKVAYYSDTEYKMI